MFPKNVSFWCVVLFLVIAMIFHHTLCDKPLVEGLVEGVKDGGKINMDEVNKVEIKMRGPPEFLEKIFKPKVPREGEEQIKNNEINEPVTQTRTRAPRVPRGTPNPTPTPTPTPSRTPSSTENALNRAINRLSARTNTATDTATDAGTGVANDATST